MHSALDMTWYWRQLDNEVAQAPMPSEYQNVTLDILCNDCNVRSTVQFHILGMKCQNCDSSLAILLKLEGLEFHWISNDQLVHHRKTQHL
ncbi:RING finger and CHY zinc finger domain-containing protein 1 [Heterocephalus glaber]|uniref:RING finger and CHY zinc finger domain-containing protein 1 n=1 Tax=Heterocephalus glaber TaxID=10181 RepID=G5BA55_HETGA|nr:RING finger and CHY zinc finger domain-containing protein 1 [Heterocephalus glaber]